MQEIDYVKTGMRIRQARRQKGWSQEELAARCGISLSFMGNLERGSRSMSLETFVKLCKALDICADELLWGAIYGPGRQTPDMAERADDGNYAMYIKIMESVAEIMSGA